LLNLNLDIQYPFLWVTIGVVIHEKLSVKLGDLNIHFA